LSFGGILEVQVIQLNDVCLKLVVDTNNCGSVFFLLSENIGVVGSELGGEYYFLGAENAIGFCKENINCSDISSCSSDLLTGSIHSCGFGGNQGRHGSLIVTSELSNFNCEGGDLCFQRCL